MAQKKTLRARTMALFMCFNSYNFSLQARSLTYLDFSPKALTKIDNQQLRVQNPRTSFINSPENVCVKTQPSPG
jgi:hypothetical protein